MMTRMTISVVVEMCSRGNSFCYLASKLLYEAATKIGKRENDRTRATLAGAAVGALIGAVIQHQGFINNYASQPVYRVTVRAMDNNNLYYFDYPQNPGVQIGEYVQVQGNQLYRLNY